MNFFLKLFLGVILEAAVTGLIKLLVKRAFS